MAKLVKWVAVPYVLGISTVLSNPSDIAKVLLPLSQKTIKDIAYSIGGNKPISMDCSLVPIGRYVKESNEIVNEHIDSTLNILANNDTSSKVIVVDMGMRNIIILPSRDKVTPLIFVIPILVFCDRKSESISLSPIELSNKKRKRISQILISQLKLSLGSDLWVATMIYHRASISYLYKEATNYLSSKLINTNMRNFAFSDFPFSENRGPLLVPVYL